MPVAIVTLVTELLAAGIQAAPLLQSLLATRAKLQASDPSRPDVDDATMAAIEAAIQAVQDKIDAAATGG